MMLEFSKEGWDTLRGKALSNSLTPATHTLRPLVRTHCV